MLLCCLGWAWAQGDAVQQLTQIEAEIDRAAEDSRGFGNPPGDIDAYVQFCDHKTEIETRLYQRMQDLLGRRRQLLSRYPALGASLADLDRSEQNILRLIQSGLEVDRDQQSISRRAQAAHYANDTATWNSIMANQGNEQARYDNILAQIKEAMANDTQLLTGIVPQLQRLDAPASAGPAPSNSAAPPVNSFASDLGALKVSLKADHQLVNAEAHSRRGKKAGSLEEALAEAGHPFDGNRVASPDTINGLDPLRLDGVHSLPPAPKGPEIPPEVANDPQIKKAISAWTAASGTYAKLDASLQKLRSDPKIPEAQKLVKAAEIKQEMSNTVALTAFYRYTVDEGVRTWKNKPK